MHKPTAISYCYGCPLPPLGYDSWTVKKDILAELLMSVMVLVAVLKRKR